MIRTLRTRSPGKARRRRVALFVSYAHDNAAWMKRLRPLLQFEYDDRARGTLDLDRAFAWHDQELKPGNQWDLEIRAALDAMDIFVPLLSADFFASRYVMEVELPRAQQRYDNGEIDVVPILLYDVNLQAKCAFLHRFNPLPAWGKAWRSYEQNGDYRDAHRPIDDGLWQAIATALARKTS